MPKYGYLVVEGPHDVEFVYRLLAPFGFRRVQWEADLDRFLAPLIPRSYPPDGDLQKRMPTPLFLQNEGHAVAVHSAIGDSRLVGTVQENAALLDVARVTGIGLILDSDKRLPAAERYRRITAQMQAIGHNLPERPGDVGTRSPHLGAYVLPDNATQGTLEDVLVHCARSVYPNLLTSAMAHIDRASQDQTLTPDDLEELGRPAGRNKAVIATVASVLRPGKAVQVSVQDNRWLRGDALTIPIVKAVQEFLVSLLELA